MRETSLKISDEIVLVLAPGSDDQASVRVVEDEIVLQTDHIYVPNATTDIDFLLQYQIAKL